MKITVTDLHTNISTTYDSMGLAARALGINDKLYLDTSPGIK